MIACPACKMFHEPKSDLSRLGLHPILCKCGRIFEEECPAPEIDKRTRIDQIAKRRGWKWVMPQAATNDQAIKTMEAIKKPIPFMRWNPFKIAP